MLEWLFDEIDSSCGDGDAAWVVKNFDLTEVRNFVIDWMSKNAMSSWSVTEIREGCFDVFNGQESLLVTTDRGAVPIWSQCTIEV